MLDRIDKAIINLLLKYKDNYITTNQIAKKVGISTLTAKRHLEKLLGEGYVEDKLEGKMRKYEINNGKGN